MSNLKKMTSFLVISLFLNGLFVGVISIEKSLAIVNPCDMEAKDWMSLDTNYRGFFVAGFLAGVIYSVRIKGYDIKSGVHKKLTIIELSDKVYQHLIAHPELRSGPIGPIIWNVIKEYFIFEPK